MPNAAERAGNCQGMALVMHTPPNLENTCGAWTRRNNVIAHLSCALQLHKRTSSDKIRLNISYNRLCDDDVSTLIQWLDAYSDLCIDAGGNNIGWMLYNKRSAKILINGQNGARRSETTGLQEQIICNTGLRTPLRLWNKKLLRQLNEVRPVTTYEDLRLLPNLDHGCNGDDLLEFDGIFTVKMRKKSGDDQWVLRLLEAKLTLTPELIDVDSVKNSSRYNSENARRNAIHSCLPTRVDRFKSVWRDFANRADVYMKNHSSATINDKLRRHFIFFRSIHALGDVVIRVAVASKNFCPRTEDLCYSKGYWCLT